MTVSRTVSFATLGEANNSASNRMDVIELGPGVSWAELNRLHERDPA